MHGHRVQMINRIYYNMYDTLRKERNTCKALRYMHDAMIKFLQIETTIASQLQHELGNSDLL